MSFSVSVFVSHPKSELPNIKINRVIQIMSHRMIYSSTGKNISLAVCINPGIHWETPHKNCQDDWGPGFQLGMCMSYHSH